MARRAAADRALARHSASHQRFAAASIALANRIGPDACIEAAQTATALARLSGPSTCLEFLGVLPFIAPEARDPAAFMVWLRTIEELSNSHPRARRS